MTSVSLSATEIERYKRHLVLKEVGGQGQRGAGKRARVLLVGAGGLGSPLALCLAAAGVGTIGIIDDDHVSLDNLQRQIAHTTASVGAPKVNSAAAAMAAINPHITVEPLNMRLDATNALDIISRYDIVADGSDNAATRYLVSDACYLAKRTLVFGAVGPFDGYVSTFKPHLSGPDDTPFPSYRCLFPEPPPANEGPNCSDVGVLGAVVGVIGTLQATEVLKEILGLGTTLAGRLLIYDALAARFESVSVGWDPENAISGVNPSITDLSIHAAAANRNSTCAA
ncbi:molybdopterin-synthase adenylyltransferase MoeB [Hyphomicrobium sp. D-2]|uniref:HesA/MoeB/ThiF family protein n=1 Tax=Hyphomicrobium sp. D-2 TaxID=3041621 RepID=UPI0024586887|nr:molybdopterin-synthase adenylyltransferase MoeB [Hyphomicrobium sp. D-2]MDH4983096.1 molybdopterin-synthase adenylyltransferase MoeB [Hyphomicrobium sp. D-2]